MKKTYLIKYIIQNLLQVQNGKKCNFILSPFPNTYVLFGIKAEQIHTCISYLYYLTHWHSELLTFDKINSIKDSN